MVSKALGLVFITTIITTLNYATFLISERYDTFRNKEKIIVFTIHVEHNRIIFTFFFFNSHPRTLSHSFNEERERDREREM